MCILKNMNDIRQCHGDRLEIDLRRRRKISINEMKIEKKMPQMIPWN